MMQRNILIWGGIILWLLAGCQSSGDSPLSGTDMPPDARSRQDRKIVTFRPDATPSAQDQALSGAVKVQSLPAVNAAVVLADPLHEQALQDDPRVLRIENDPIATIQVFRRSTRRPRTVSAETLPWGVQSIKADRVWDRNGDLAPDANAGQGVKVAVVDTGIDLAHPDLAANIAGGYNAIDPGQSPQDDNGHGTHVAGIIAAAADGAGVIGAAPRVSLYAVKVLGSDGNGYYSDIIEGIQWCMNNGMQVINLSLGGYEDVRALHDVVSEAARRGIVITAAAGNDGPADNSVGYPARYPEVIAVAAYNASRDLADYSSRGPEIDLLAPGDDILSTVPGNAYQSLSGTSMAVPHASAAAALVIAAGVTTPAAVRARLRLPAGPRGYTRSFTTDDYTLVDAERAVPGSRSPLR
ncbi:MAG: S8 family peptidase [Armatimonadota bacterium]